MTHTFQTSTILPYGRTEVFPFFAEAGNLERITPSELCFRILTPEPIRMGQGTLIQYRLRLYGIPFRWSSLITLWDPPHRFVDVQHKGPYKLWVHTHRFMEQDGGTKMTDEVVYELPFAPLGEIFYPLIHRLISRIFLFRRRRIREIFGNENLALARKN